jgi:predicted unusual protein kinase regulating ubiquinone biosynthesis (AarF/ABC1/UbiB family)
LTATRLGCLHSGVMRPEVTMNESSSGLGRTAQILQFLLKYRSAGVFTGLDLDAATLDAGTEPATEGKPAEFANDLEALGPTFIKIGQALSTRPDMVPAPYLAALERMQDEVAPVPFEDIRRVVEEELGVRMNLAFASFDETPLGSASLAQVHRATLRDGKPVAVKVQRPGIADSVREDLDALMRLAGHADRMTDLGRRMRFADWVHEFGKALMVELDYRAEAENLERFGEHCSSRPRSGTTAPRAC